MKSVAILIITLILSAVVAPDHHAEEGVGLAHSAHTSSAQATSDLNCLDEAGALDARSGQPESTDTAFNIGHACHLGHCPAVLFQVSVTPQMSPIGRGSSLPILLVQSVHLDGLRRPPRA